MSLSARKNTQNFSVKIQCFSWNLSFEHLFVEWALFELSNEHFFIVWTLFENGFLRPFSSAFYHTNYSRFAFFHLAGVHPSFSVNDLIKLLRERKPEDSASFCILISGCFFSMFFAYSNRRPVIHSRNVILYVVLI